MASRLNPVFLIEFIHTVVPLAVFNVKYFQSIYWLIEIYLYMFTVRYDSKFITLENRILLRAE